MTLKEQLKEIIKEIEHFIYLNDVDYGEIKIVVKRKMVYDTAMTKKKILDN